MKKCSSRFIQEITNCQRSQHKNVIHIFGASTWPNSIAIVMEYMPGGSLADFVGEDEIPIGGFLRFRCCLEIANGLAYLHNLKPKRLIHGDLKAENVLLTEDLNCKIADFGSSVGTSYTGRTSTSKQISEKSEYTEIYAAPELLRDIKAIITTAIDTYSFSMIIYVVLKREPPVPNENYERLYLESIKAGERPNLRFIDDLSKEFSVAEFDVVKQLVTMMEQCWSQNSSDRPLMKNVYQELCQIQSGINLAQQRKEITTALDKMTILKPVQSEYRCTFLDMFHPPNFQLMHLGSGNC